MLALPVDAIQQIKRTYGIERNWMGDPCLPNAYSWSGLACSKDNLPRIISLNLSSSRLNGKISASFADLKLIERLDLSDNKLTGNIPDFLAQLPSLTLLDLSGNSLTGHIPYFLAQLPLLTHLNLANNSLSGSIPLLLLQREKNKSLTLSVVGNPELCKLEPCQKHSKPLWIIAVVAAVIATAFLLLVMWKLLCSRRKQQGLTEVSGPSHQGEHMNCFGVGFSTSQTNSTDSNFKFDYSTSADDSTRKGEIRGRSFRLDNLEFTDVDVLQMTNNFEKEIGKGGFGTVYLGEKYDGTQVAVKRLKEMSQGSRMFLNEAKLLMKVRHKNIVPFIGYCNGVHKCLIYRYMSGGNLRDYLSDKDGAKDWPQRLKISLSVAKGLEYLHNGCDPVIVHRDIKPENILLNEKLVAKIADFGLGKMFHEECVIQAEVGMGKMFHEGSVAQAESSVKGTFGYLDPEYFQYNFYREGSDVYSFGVVLLQLITGKHVHVVEASDMTHITEWVEKKSEISDIVDPRLKGSFQKMSIEKAIDLAKKCTLSNSSSRPTMGHVLSELTACWEIEKTGGSTWFYMI